MHLSMFVPNGVLTSCFIKIARPSNYETLPLLQVRAEPLRDANSEDADMIRQLNNEKLVSCFSHSLLPLIKPIVLV